MTFTTIVVGLAERDGDDDAMALAIQLVDPEGAELVRSHVDRHHRWSSPAPGLLEAIAVRNADLVVVGSGPRAASGRLVPTRTAMQLVQHAPCPVAIAPQGYRGAGAFRHIGVAYDGTGEADTAVSVAYALAERDRAAVTLYWTIRDGRIAYAGMPASDLDLAGQRARVHAQDALDAAADRAPGGVNPETVLLRGDPATDIGSAADGIVDLLVTGSRGPGPVRRMVGDSVSEQLILAATQPVIVVSRAPVS
jgi:nucleotide-binding universal stress UspA family protein